MAGLFEHPKKGPPVDPAALFHDLTTLEPNLRRLILAAALLASTACNRQPQAEETTGVDQNVTAEVIGGNDLTAIDAATNDAANMAADAELGLNAADANALDANNADGEATPGNAAAGNATAGNEQ